MPARASWRWDGALAASAAGALLLDGWVWTPGASPAAYPLALATSAVLIGRRRAPMLVLLATGAGLVACLAVFAPYRAAIAVAMVPLYTVAVLGDRRRSLIVGAITALGLVAAISVIGATGSVSDGSTRLLLVLGALIVGDAVRTRRALRAAAAAEAERVEAEREQESRRRVAGERLRIARELHDTLAHALVAINVRAGVAAHTGRDAAAALGEIKDVSAAALGDLRTTLDLLREEADAAPTQPALDLAGLPALLESARAGGLRAAAEVTVDGTAIPSPIGQAGYRIVQESLTNVLRHARASSARVVVRVVDRALDIEVVDDGRGGSGAGEGHGLRGMSERADALGGRVVAGPGERGGWRVHARLPLAGAGTE